MIDFSGKIVVSEAGNDKGGAFLVLRQEGEYVFCADGKKRKAATPKKKKTKHIREVAESGLTDIGCVTDGRIRKVLASYRRENAETNCSDNIIKEE